QLHINSPELYELDSLNSYGALTKPITVTEKPKPIFPRLDTETEVAFIKDSMQGSAPQAEEAKEETKEEAQEDAKPQITIKDFDKVEIKAATVMDAENVKKSDKLLKIQVDLGEEQRQIVSGIAKFYEP